MIQFLMLLMLIDQSDTNSQSNQIIRSDTNNNNGRSDYYGIIIGLIWWRSSIEFAIQIDRNNNQADKSK